MNIDISKIILLGLLLSGNMYTMKQIEQNVDLIINFKEKNEKTITVPRSTAEISGLLYNMLEDEDLSEGETPLIPIPNMNRKEMYNIVKLMQKEAQCKKAGDNQIKILKELYEIIEKIKNSTINKIFNEAQYLLCENILLAATLHVIKKHPELLEKGLLSLTPEKELQILEAPQNNREKAQKLIIENILKNLDISYSTYRDVLKPYVKKIKNIVFQYVQATINQSDFDYWYDGYKKLYPLNFLIITAITYIAKNMLYEYIKEGLFFDAPTDVEARRLLSHYDYGTPLEAKGSTKRDEKSIERIMKNINPKSKILKGILISIAKKGFDIYPSPARPSKMIRPFSNHSF